MVKVENPIGKIITYTFHNIAHIGITVLVLAYAILATERCNANKALAKQGERDKASLKDCELENARIAQQRAEVISKGFSTVAKIVQQEKSATTRIKGESVRQQANFIRRALVKLKLVPHTADTTAGVKVVTTDGIDAVQFDSTANAGIRQGVELVTIAKDSWTFLVDANAELFTGNERQRDTIATQREDIIKYQRIEVKRERDCNRLISRIFCPSCVAERRERRLNRNKS